MTRFSRDLRNGLAAAEVIARRMPTLWMMPFLPTAGAQAEVTRMVAEKQIAAAEGLVSASITAAMQGQQLWFKAMTGTLKTEDVTRAQRRVQRAALLPAGKRVRANVKRLRKA